MKIKKIYKIFNKCSQGERLDDDEQRWLDMMARLWMYISLGITLPISIAALAIAIMKMATRP